MLKAKFLNELDEKTQRNVNVSVRDAMGHSAMLGATEQYFSAFAIFLKASTLQIGILASLPQLFAALCQLFSLRALENTKSRKFLISSGSKLQGVILFLLMFLPFVFRDTLEAVPVLIFAVLLSSGAFGFTAPIWTSLIGDLIPAAYRGRYFGLRNQRMGLCTFLSMIISGLLLDFFAKYNLVSFGFFCVFGFACLYKCFSTYWILQYEDPEYISKRESYFSLWQFVSRIRYANFTRFVFFASLVQGMAAFSAPYFAIYFLDVIKLSYFEFTIVIATPTITQIIALQNWGKLVERFGSKQILTVCSFGVAINPLFWLFPFKLWLALVIQIFSGLVWSGFNLAVSTFLFDAVTPGKRARCSAYQALIQGVFVLVGSLSGAYVVKRIPEEFDLFFFTWHPFTPLFIIFFLSGIMRLITAIVFRRLFSEVRDVPKTKAIELLFHFFPLTETAEALSVGFLARNKSNKS